MKKGRTSYQSGLSPQQRLLEGLKNTRNFGNAIGQGLLSIGTSAVAEPVSGIGGLLAFGATRGDSDKAAQAVRNIQEAMTYQPTNAGTQGAMQQAGSLLQPVGNFLNERFADIEDATGFPSEFSEAALTAVAELAPVGLIGKAAKFGKTPRVEVPSNFSQSGAVSRPKKERKATKAENEASGVYHPSGLGKKLEILPSDVKTTHTDKPFYDDYKDLDIQGLLGSRIINVSGDKSVAGRKITGINGIELPDSVDADGGRDFMRANPDAAWAADLGATNGLLGQARRAMDAGKKPVISMSPMGYGSMNFNTMMSELVLGQMQAGDISKTAKGMFDKDMRKAVPAWTSIDDPISRELIDRVGEVRHQFMSLAALDKYKKKGFPDLNATRLALTEDTLINATPYESGHGFASLTGDMVENPIKPHQTYSHQAGKDEYLGGTSRSIPTSIAYPDWYNKRRAENKPENKDYRSFSLGNVSQDIDQEWIDRVSDFVEPYTPTDPTAAPMPMGSNAFGKLPALPNAPTEVNLPTGLTSMGRNKASVKAAENLSKQADFPFNLPDKHIDVDQKNSALIAREYELMKHDPENPEVKEAYSKLVEETNLQYDELLRQGVKPYWSDPKHPSSKSPSLVHADMWNNGRLPVFPTDNGFGGDSAFDTGGHPLMAMSKYELDGKPMRENDVFRAVHDFLGHGASGSGFRAKGELNAGMHHMGMYSPKARKAAASETLGQNSWLNFNEGSGKLNQTAGIDGTIFADQKAGLLPNFVAEGRRNETYDKRTALEGGMQPTDQRLDGAISPEGLLQAVHYSDRKLDRIDPEYYGNNLSGRTIAERNRSNDPNFVNRSFFGVEATENPYVKEGGIGNIKHEAEILPEHIYDARNDIANLNDGDITSFEKNIYNQNFSGYFVDHAQLGKVIVMFDPIEAKKLKESGFADPIMLAGIATGGAMVMLYNRD